MSLNVNPYPGPHMPIRQWSDDDKPREKLMQHGPATLSNTELLAILLHAGHRNKSAVALAQEILHTAHNNLSELGKLSVRQLQKLKGIGHVKAITIVAAMELARRRQAGFMYRKTMITSGSEAALFFKPLLSDHHYETFYVVFLNYASRVLHYRCLSQGGITSAIVDPRLIFREALEAGATKLLLCHNHPSGSLRPSEADIRITRRIKEMGRLLDMEVLDHIIVSEAGYYSLAEEGVL